MLLARAFDRKISTHRLGRAAERLKSRDQPSAPPIELRFEGRAGFEMAGRTRCCYFGNTPDPRVTLGEPWVAGSSTKCEHVTQSISQMRSDFFRNSQK